MTGASFMAESVENVMDGVMHNCYSVEQFFYGRGGEFIVVVKVYGAWIKGIETSVAKEFGGSVSCCLVVKVSERLPSSSAVLSIMAVDR